MGKKRGGRGGKGSGPPEDQPPKTERPTQTEEPKPQPTKQQPLPQQSLAGPSEPPKQPQIGRGGPSPAQSRSESEQFWGGARPRQEHLTSGWGRGEPIERDVQRESYPRGRGGRGRGRGRGAPSSHPGSEQTWGGARPRDKPGQEPPTPVWGRGEPVEQRGPYPEGRGKGRGRPFPRQGGGAKPEQRPPTEQSIQSLPSSAADSKSGTTPQGLSLKKVADVVPFKPGTRGRPIRIETNHVRLDLGSLKLVYRYDVAVKPDKKPKWMVRAAFELFRKAYFPENNPSYDGQKLLYSAKKLPHEADAISGKVTLALDQGKSQEFEIAVKLTGTLDLSLLNNLLQKKNIALEELFQCIEVVFKQAYVSSFINVGRRFYTQPSSINEYFLGTGAQMYLGGYQAAVKGWLPFLNVDVAHKAFTTPTPIPHLIIEMFSSRFKPLTERDLKTYTLQRWQTEQMNEYLKGLKVVYQIPTHPGSKKTYRINALSNIPSQEKFRQDNQIISVEEYFRTKWHCNLQYPNLPTIWVGNKDKKICLPMEYCTLQEKQPIDGAKMTSNQTSKMINYSATDTTERKRKIQNIMAKANHNQNACIREFGFSISNQFENLDARVLDPPELDYLGNKVQPRNGEWRANRFKMAAQIQKWGVVAFGLQRDRVNSAVNQLVKMLVDYGASTGMYFSKPEQSDFIRNDPRSLATCLHNKKSYDLIIVIIQNKEAYYTVKQTAEQQVGCLTQCIKSETITNQKKLNESTIRNILLKINCKMNGTNHVLFDSKLLSDQPCMVMGADVTHPSPHARTIPSVVAVTASHNLTATSYNISVFLQDPRTEIILNLKTVIQDNLKKFNTNTGQLPATIFFYRDGVSDGEFDKVREKEIDAIKQGCGIFRRGYSPKITFLVVQKRHHTRFFPTDDNSCGDRKNFNVPVGTYVDTVITDPTIQNFFLLSHQSIRGVARPTKYCTLYDDNGFTNDDLQQLTYYLCHLFTRCNRAVSYPAPTYFAHLAADRAKGYLYKKVIDLDHLDQRLVQINQSFAAKNPMFFS